MNTEPQLEISGLEKRFESEFELSGIDLTVGSDEIVALLGPSGCGKTTILRCIAGVETPEGGTINIDGDTVESSTVSKPPEERHIGMVYQSYAIWPHKTVYENVIFPLEHASHGIPRSEFRNRVEGILELMEISELADEPATNLSGGQQQRTALARALVHEPELLLMDEPLSNLDKELRKQMRYELQRIQQELGVSMLYVTHDQEEAFYLADRVVVLRDGAVVERGPPEKLYRSPDSPFTRRFVGARNPFGGRIQTDTAGDRIVRTEFVDVPLSKTEYMSNGADGDVDCFLRPDDIDICGDGREDDRIEMEGTVVAEGILGDRYEITVGFDGTDTELTVHCDQYRDLSRGERLTLGFAPKTLQVYRSQ
ncbi:ABC transporter ATP-binding protein [Halobacteriaceae archaeon SHR40]|uniref:ABC transporter ATP-binding protein n=1 Tax=Halovenus amylolytica TaxID=2500550 RepID=UPI000FE2E454